MPLDTFGRATPANSYTRYANSGGGQNYNDYTRGVAQNTPQWQTAPGGRPYSETVLGMGANVNARYGTDNRQANAGAATNYVNSLMRRNHNPTGALIDVFASQYAPEMAGYQNQADALYGQLAHLEANRGLQERYAREDYANDLALLGLDRAGLGIAGQGLNDRDAYLNQLLGFAQQQLAQQMAGLDIDQRESGERQQQDTWRHRSDLTSRGAMHTPFQRIGQNWIDQEATNRNERIGLGRQGAQLGFERESASIADQRRSNDRARQELGLQARRIGVQESQLRTSLERTLQNLGLDSLMSVNDVMQGINSNEIAIAELNRQILQQAEQGAIMGWSVPAPRTTYTPNTSTTTSRNRNRNVR